ncbi:leucine-rich repeat domain-containing protein [Rickettsiales endosymbiont of Stachyamoeba lipophora]|uniref:hypothetical protein n=1 Tax=Rickettsiales endosymbiont of Stachyamoeba lipophora TaxID=2486578 RepID=UPI000F654E43|nr:hypothetical protein [Rickettsiales endosymbiont of Stachyamoeba lipophora]AZL16347.1 hypothetical protein EF513_07400 [Rickettsiales endosymbiont of Stachyamoeba lipophora]
MEKYDNQFLIELDKISFSEDIAIFIFSFINKQDLVQKQSVSKAWRRLIRKIITEYFNEELRLKPRKEENNINEESSKAEYYFDTIFAKNLNLPLQLAREGFKLRLDLDIQAILDQRSIKFEQDSLLEKYLNLAPLTSHSNAIAQKVKQFFVNLTTSPSRDNSRVVLNLEDLLKLSSFLQQISPKLGNKQQISLIYDIDSIYKLYQYLIFIKVNTKVYTLDYKLKLTNLKGFSSILQIAYAHQLELDSEQPIDITEDNNTIKIYITKRQALDIVKRLYHLDSEKDPSLTKITLIAKLIEGSQFLEHLNLNHPILNNDDFMLFRNSLLKNNSLKILDLREATYSNEQIIQLGITINERKHRITSSKADQSQPLLRYQSLQVKAKTKFQELLIALLTDPQSSKVSDKELFDNFCIYNYLAGELSEEAVIAIADSLSYNPEITAIDLSGKKIGLKGAYALARMIKKNNRLTTLILSQNEIDDQGAIELAEALKSNTKLQNLDLSNNKIGNQGMLAFTEAFQENKTLNIMDFSSNNFTFESVLDLAISPRSNRFSFAQDKSVLAKLLSFFTTPTSTTVQELRFPLGESLHSKITVIAQTLRRNKSVIKLSFKGNYLDPEDITILVGVLKSHPSIKVLDLSKNCLFEKSEKYNGAQAIAQLLQVNKVIEVLDLSVNFMNDLDIEILTEVLIANHTLKKLVLKDNQITLKSVIKLGLVSRVKNFTVDTGNKNYNHLLKVIINPNNFKQIDLSKRAWENDELVTIIAQSLAPYHQVANKLIITNYQPAKIIIDQPNITNQQIMKLAQTFKGTNVCFESGDKLKNELLEVLCNQAHCIANIATIIDLAEILKDDEFELELNGKLKQLFLLLHSPTKITSGKLDLSHSNLRNEGVIAIAKVLRTNQNIMELNLAFNDFKDPSLIELASALKYNTTLKQLDLTLNTVGDKGVVALAEMIKQNSSLQKLILKDTNLSKKSIIQLALAARGKSIQIEFGNRKANLLFNSAKQLSYAAQALLMQFGFTVEMAENQTQEPTQHTQDLNRVPTRSISEFYFAAHEANRTHSDFTSRLDNDSMNLC